MNISQKFNPSTVLTPTGMVPVNLEIEPKPLEERLENITSEIVKDERNKSLAIGVATGLGLGLLSHYWIETEGFCSGIEDLFTYFISPVMGLTTGLIQYCSEKNHYKTLERKHKELENTYGIKPLELTEGTKNLGQRIQRIESLRHINPRVQKIDLGNDTQLIDLEATMGRYVARNDIPLTVVKNNKLIAHGRFDLSDSSIRKKSIGPVTNGSNDTYLMFNLEDNDKNVEEEYELMNVNNETGEIKFLNLGIEDHQFSGKKSYITNDNRFMVVKTYNRAEQQYDGVTLIDPAKKIRYMFEDQRIEKQEWEQKVKGYKPISQENAQVN